MDSEILMNLQNEWKYLHVAAKTWRWLKDNPRADQDGVPLHTLVMAMDSAFLHGRSLYEFFGLIPDKRPDPETKLATVADIGVTAALRSPWLDTWRWAMNARLLHFRASRTDVYDKPVAKGGTTQPSGINCEVENMLTDLMDIWERLLNYVSAPDRRQLETVMTIARQDVDPLVNRLQILEQRIP